MTRALISFVLLFLELLIWVAVVKLICFVYNFNIIMETAPVCLIFVSFFSITSIISVYILARMIMIYSVQTTCTCNERA